MKPRRRHYHHQLIVGITDPKTTPNSPSHRRQAPQRRHQGTHSPGFERINPSNEMARRVGLLLSLLSCVVGSPEFTEIRVMSFNIRYDTPNDGANRWEKRKHMVASAFRFHRADIVGTQEALGHQLEDLQAALGTGWTRYSRGRTAGGHENEHCAIWWRTDRFIAVHQGTFWLSPTPSKVGATPRHVLSACSAYCTAARVILPDSVIWCELCRPFSSLRSQPQVAAGGTLTSPGLSRGWASSTAMPQRPPSLSLSSTHTWTTAEGLRG